jgi:hypothetical protein
MTTDNYYFLTNKDYPEVASAFAPDNIKLAHELIPKLAGAERLPFDLKLVKLSLGKNGLIKSNDLSGLNLIWLDLQPNSLVWPLMSEQLKNFVINNLTGKEYINWISTMITGGNEKRIYYIPRFERKLDVLDEKNTMYVKGTDHIIRPHFSLKKIKDLTIFHMPDSHDFWKIPSALYINETLRKGIIKEKFIGIGFEKVRVS